MHPATLPPCRPALPNTGYQTNLMVSGPGGYRFLDYTRFGLPLQVGARSAWPWPT